MANKQSPIWEITEERGWNDDSICNLAVEFIIKQKLEGAFCDFLAEVAEEEDSWCLDCELGLE